MVSNYLLAPTGGGVRLRIQSIIDYILYRCAHRLADANDRKYMSAYLKYPDLHIEILCENGHNRVRDTYTGEVRQLPISTSEEDDEEEEADKHPKVER